jgi:hypothetical protein
VGIPRVLDKGMAVRIRVLMNGVLVGVVVLVAGALAVLIAMTPMGVAVEILADAESDEQDTGHEADRPADPDPAEDFNWLVDLSEIKVSFRVEKHDDHRNAAEQMANAENDTRCKSVHPLVGLVQGVGSGDRPPMTRLNTVHGSEGDCPGQQPERFAFNHPPIFDSANDLNNAF